MSVLTFELSPKQWEGIETYEATSALTSLSKDKVTIKCENLAIVITRWRGQEIPKEIRALSGDRAKLKKATLTIRNPEFFCLKTSLFDEAENRHVVNSENEEILLSKKWGEPHPNLNVYQLWGFLDWPSSSINELMIGSRHRLEFTFEETECCPIE